MNLQGKKINVIGDSITQGVGVSSVENAYQNVMGRMVGAAEVRSFGISGPRLARQYGADNYPWPFTERFQSMPDDADLVVVFGGTNDFNASAPLGEIYTVKEETTNKDGQERTLLHRSYTTDNATFAGRVNNLLSAVKTHFPEARVLMLSPIHRGFAKFGDRNVQPDELWANNVGLFLDDYIHCLGQAGRAWAVPMLDTHIHTQLFPIYNSYDAHINRVDTDRLHPNVKGHHHIALSVQGYLEHTIPLK